MGMCTASIWWGIIDRTTGLLVSNNERALERVWRRLEDGEREPATRASSCHSLA